MGASSHGIYGIYGVEWEACPPSTCKERIIQAPALNIKGSLGVGFACSKKGRTAGSERANSVLSFSGLFIPSQRHRLDALRLGGWSDANKYNCLVDGQDSFPVGQMKHGEACVFFSLLMAAWTNLPKTLGS